jgi:hypothetical protein
MAMASTTVSLSQMAKNLRNQTEFLSQRTVSQEFIYRLEDGVVSFWDRLDARRAELRTRQGVYSRNLLGDLFGVGGFVGPLDDTPEVQAAVALRKAIRTAAESQGLLRTARESLKDVFAH